MQKPPPVGLVGECRVHGGGCVCTCVCVRVCSGGRWCGCCGVGSTPGGRGRAAAAMPAPPPTKTDAERMQDGHARTEAPTCRVSGALALERRQSGTGCDWALPVGLSRGGRTISRCVRVHVCGVVWWLATCVENGGGRKARGCVLCVCVQAKQGGQMQFRSVAHTWL